MQQVILDSESDTCEEVGDRTSSSNETQEYFEVDETSIKCEKIVISSDSEDDVHVIPTFPTFHVQNLSRAGEVVNPVMISRDPFEKDPWTKCCLCNITIKHKNIEKHCQKAHMDEMRKKCKEAL